MSDKRPSNAVLTTSIVILCIIWGSTWLAIKAGIQDVPPFTSGALRFAIASVLMTGVCAWLSAKEGGAKPTWKLRLSMGVFNFTGCYAVVYWVESILPSGLVSVLWAIYPLMMAGVGHVYLPDERMSVRQWSGLAFGFVGVAFLFATDLPSLGPDAIWAACVLLLSPASSAIGSALIKRHGKSTNSLMLNRDGMIMCSLAMGALAFSQESTSHFIWSARAIGSILYLASFGTVVTFGLYFWVLRYLPASKLSLVSYVTPAIALLLGTYVGGETVGLQTLAGLGLILVGVAFASAKGRKRVVPDRTT